MDKSQSYNRNGVGSVLPRRSSPSTGGRRGSGPLILRGAVGTARWPQRRDALSANPLVDRGAQGTARLSRGERPGSVSLDAFLSRQESISPAGRDPQLLQLSRAAHTTFRNFSYLYAIS